MIISPMTSLDIGETNADWVTLDRIIKPTHNIIDQKQCLAALYYARAKGIETVAIEMILGKRLAWLNWQTVTQRKWQAHTHNHNKARCHDSIEIREKYVRC